MPVSLTTARSALQVGPSNDRNESPAIRFGFTDSESIRVLDLTAWFCGEWVAKSPATARPSTAGQWPGMRLLMQDYGQAWRVCGQGRPRKASTHDPMWLEFRSMTMSIVPIASVLTSSARALIGAPGTLRNLLTSAEMSLRSGCADVDGGFNGESTSPHRVVAFARSAGTAAQLASTPRQLAAKCSTPAIVRKACHSNAPTRLGPRLALGDPELGVTKLVDHFFRRITLPAQLLCSLIQTHSLSYRVDQFEGKLSRIRSFAPENGTVLCAKASH